MQVVYTVTVANAEDLRRELVAWLEERYDMISEQRNDRSPVSEKYRINAKLNEISFIKDFIAALSIQPAAQHESEDDEDEEA